MVFRNLLDAHRLVPSFAFLTEDGRYRVAIADDSAGMAASALYRSAQLWIAVARDRAEVTVALAAREADADYVPAELLAEVAREEAGLPAGAAPWPSGPPAAVAARLRDSLPSFERLLSPAHRATTAARIARLRLRRRRGPDAGEPGGPSRGGRTPETT